MNNINQENYYDEVNKIMLEIVIQNMMSQKHRYLTFPSSDDFPFWEGRLKMYIEEMIAMLNTKQATYIEIRTNLPDMKNI